MVNESYEMNKSHVKSGGSQVKLSEISVANKSSSQRLIKGENMGVNKKNQSQISQGNKKQIKRGQGKNTKKSKRSKGRKMNLFVEVTPDKFFYFKNGTFASSISELVDILDSIPDDVFSYHVNDYKNDLYSWIKFVFGEDDLADRILSVRDPKSVQVVILREMVSRLKPKRAVKKGSKSSKK
ncbi:MAG: hypothetical protein GWP09_00455 [Nitrospiraceae bacterium]|nr:hypothetical protein [Nitrospiraceae bacterium]